MEIRIELGAQAGSLSGLVLREAVILVAAGIALVFTAARLIDGLLFGVAPAGPATLVGSPC